MAAYFLLLFLWYTFIQTKANPARSSNQFCSGENFKCWWANHLPGNIHIGWAKSFSKAAKWLLLLTSPSLSHDPLQATGCADPNRRGEPQDPNTQSGQTRLLLKTDLLCGAIIVCGHICFTFLHCVFSNASSNCLSEKMHTRIDCICLVFLHCGP